MVIAVSMSPTLTECQADDQMRSGWHIARRRDWVDQGRFEIVWLDIWEDDGGIVFNVWRAGGAKPENPMDWIFQLRIGGFRSKTDDPIELKAIVLQ